MKQGYMQMKMSEFQERLKVLNEKEIVLELKFRKIEEKIGIYDELIEKLREIEDFKKVLSEKMRSENRELFLDFKENTHNEFHKWVNGDFVKIISKSMVERVTENLLDVQSYCDRIWKRMDDVQTETKEAIEFYRRWINQSKPRR